MKKINFAELSTVLQENFKLYTWNAMLDRAIPSIRDGLKPVHRKILYALYNLKGYNGHIVKSVAIVGEAIKIHPHGDTAIYGALTNLAQPWKNTLPLITFQGNVGGIDNSPPASARYTEAMLSQYGYELMHIFNSVDKEIDMPEVMVESELQDGTKEPAFFPTFIPNILINGILGIVLEKSDIPPFNFNEVLDLCIKIAKKQSIKNDLLYPDYGNAGCFGAPLMVYATKEEWKEINETGKGHFSIFCQVQTNAKKPNEIDILNIPAINTNSEKVKIRLINLFLEKNSKTYDKNVVEIIDAYDGAKDTTDKFDIKVICKKTIKKDAVKKIIKIIESELAINKSVQMTMIKDDKIVQLGPKAVCVEIVNYSLDYIKVLKNRELINAKNELEIVSGLVKLAKHWNEIKDWIIKVKDKNDMVTKLQNLGFTLRQSDYIAEIKLHRLSKVAFMEHTEKEKALNDLITYLTDFLNNDDLIRKFYIDKLKEYKKMFNLPRFTQVLDKPLIGGTLHNEETE